MPKKLIIETNAPDDYMIDILRHVRNSIAHGKYEGNGKVNRVDMISYPYSYQLKKEATDGN